jgi:hypothetical protein
MAKVLLEALEVIPQETGSLKMNSPSSEGVSTNRHGPGKEA